MTPNGRKCWGLVGGAGFIGQHLALSILNRSSQDVVHLLDIQRPAEIAWRVPLQDFVNTGRVVLHECDVRYPQSLFSESAEFDVIVNLAAVHREPGHRPEEYFETNVSGAENVCGLAEDIDCQEIIFTSSISVYGVHDRPADEDSELRPHTPYGLSKRKAEQIHQEWAARTGGRLAIIRPGVVFGPGENGNVTRLVREMLRRKRIIRLNPDRPKAGIYIEELLEVVHWLRDRSWSPGKCLMLNAVSESQLTFNAYGLALQELLSLKNPPLVVPERMLKVAASVISPLSPFFDGASRFHPQRLSKILLANDIRPTNLTRMGYPFAWPLTRALADWLAKGV